MVAGAFYDRNGEATDGYLIGQDREDYFNMIDSLVEQVGQNVTIELTNETNEDIMVDGSILVAKYVEPAKYAEFYKDVASRLKQKYPDLKLAIAGTAASDPKYIREVLEHIGDPNLVDVISTHPYRASIDGPSAVNDDSKTTSYLDEEDELISLAKEYGASYQIGAVTYADEADLINVALFGMTAKEWREQNPNEKGNMRDEANIAEGQMTIEISNIYDQVGLGEGYVITKPSNSRMIYSDNRVLKLTTEIINRKRLFYRSFND